MSGLSRFAVAVGCAFAAFVALETARWLRPVALAVSRHAQPMASVGADGKAVLVREETTNDDDPSSTVWRVFDKTGRPTGTIPPRSGKSSVDLGPFVRDEIDRMSNPWSRFGDTDVRVDEPSAAESVLRDLRYAQGEDTPQDALRRSARMSVAAPWWTFESGRFVCRDLRDGDVLAGFGPDGYSLGAQGAAGESFSADVAAIIDWNWYAARAGDWRNAAAPVGTLLDSSGRRVHFLTVERPPKVKSHEGPLQIGVATVRAEGPRGEPPLCALEPHTTWMWGDDWGVHADEFMVPLRAGRDLVLVRRKGIAYRITPAEDELDFSPAMNVMCVASVLAPVGAPISRLRVRRLLPEGETIAADVETIPVTTGGRVATACVGLLSCVRPPVLLAASWLGPAPKDYDDYFSRRLADGVVAGREGTAWLLGGFAVAALCGWFARSQARLRDPARVGLWAALGAACGPLGLVWMRIAMPKSHVAACACGRRRAVHVSVCPTCAADWPAPQPTGIEVLA